MSKIIFPLVIVLTQDCDLEQDYRFRYSRQRKPDQQDKWLLSVLVAPLYNAEHVFLGEQLSELNMKMQTIARSKTRGKSLTSNQLPRFHYLEFPRQFQIAPSVIDFKHYFSVNVKYLHRNKSKNFICSVSSFIERIYLSVFPPFYLELVFLKLLIFRLFISPPAAVAVYMC